MDAYEDQLRPLDQLVAIAKQTGATEERYRILAIIARMNLSSYVMDYILAAISTPPESGVFVPDAPGSEVAAVSGR